MYPGQIEGSLGEFVADGWISTRLQQSHHAAHLGMVWCFVKWCVTMVITHIHISSPLKRDPNIILMTHTTTLEFMKQQREEFIKQILRDLFQCCCTIKRDNLKKKGLKWQVSGDGMKKTPQGNELNLSKHNSGQVYVDKRVLLNTQQRTWVLKTKHNISQCRNKPAVPE